jgi:hypothetical protein
LNAPHNPRIFTNQTKSGEWICGDDAQYEAGHCVAALAYAIPLVSITIEHRPHLHRGLCRAEANLALEAMVTLCLAGPEAEKQFCGAITDHSGRIDYQMARDYLARQLNPLQVGAETCSLPRRRATPRAFALGTPSHSFARRRPVAAWKFERRADFRTRGLTRR